MLFKPLFKPKKALFCFSLFLLLGACRSAGKKPEPAKVPVPEKPALPPPVKKKKSGLNAIWFLKEIEGFRVKNEGQRRPYIGFDVENRRFTGEDGCNRIAGTVTVTAEKPNRLKIKSFLQTRMFCSVPNVYGRLSWILEESTRYRIKGKSLLFADKRGKVLLRFQKAD